MLIRIFAMIGAAGSVLSALFANCGYKGAKLGGFMMLRFLEYFRFASCVCPYDARRHGGFHKV